MSVLTIASIVDSGLATAPKVNLLPPEIFAARELRTLQARCAAALGGAVVVAGLWAAIAIHGAHSADSELEAAQQNQTSTQSQIRAYDSVAATRAKADKADQISATARDGEVRWSHSMAFISKDIPANVSMTRVSVAPPAAAGSTGAPPTASDAIAVITVTGNARTHNDVATWLDNVAKQKGWDKPYFTESKNAELNGQKVEEFTSTINVTKDSLRNTDAANGANS